MFEGIFQPMHLLVIFVIAILVFGPKKLPELGKGLGDAIRGFKSAGGHTRLNVQITLRQRTRHGRAAHMLNVGIGKERQQTSAMRLKGALHLIAGETLGNKMDAFVGVVRVHTR